MSVIALTAFLGILGAARIVRERGHTPISGGNYFLSVHVCNYLVLTHMSFPVRYPTAFLIKQ